jgi:hypothetical protein
VSSGAVRVTFYPFAFSTTTTSLRFFIETQLPCGKNAEYSVYPFIGYKTGETFNASPTMNVLSMS